MSKTVVTCALTGVLTDPAQHHVPVTPEQMAREARAAFDAGASVMHVHFRQQAPGKGSPAVLGSGGRRRDRASDPGSLPRRDLQPVHRSGRAGHLRARGLHARNPSGDRGLQRRLPELPEGPR